MLVKVKETFIDKFTGAVYSPCDSINIEDVERIKDLSKRGLINEVELDEGAVKKTSKTTRTKKEK